MSINVTVTGNPVCCTKRNYLLADPDVTKKNEFNRRRKLRIEQVRQQSKDLASHLRQEFRKEREKQINKFEQEQISELAKWQARKLLSLQEKYQECISQVGTGHRQAAEEPDYGSILADQRNRNLDAAKQRGKVASDKAKKESEEAQAKANEVAERHKLKRTVEDLRSTMISSIGKAVRKTKTVDRPLQEITVNVPGDGRGTRIKTTRTTSDDQCETIVKTFYKEASPPRPKIKRKPQKAGKRGTDSLTLDLSELNKSGTSFERSDAAESFQDISEQTGRTYTKTTTTIEKTRRNLAQKDTRSSPLRLPIVDVSDDDEEMDTEGLRVMRNRVEVAEDNHEMRDVGVQVGAAEPPRVAPKERVGVTRKPPGPVRSVREKQAAAKSGRSCYCPENPGPTTVSSSDLSDPYTSQPAPNVTPAASTTATGKVQMYDHTARYHREYAAPDVVERVPRQEQTTSSSSEHVSHAALALRQATAQAEAARAAQTAAKQRGARAGEREAARRDYVRLLADLQTLSREERMARGALAPAAADVHLSDARRKERQTVRQRNMDSAFEAVLHRTAPTGHEAPTPEPTPTTGRRSPASRRPSPPPTPAQLNVAAAPEPSAPAPRDSPPKYVIVLPYSPDFSETSVVLGIDHSNRSRQDAADGAEDRARKRLEMDREEGGRKSPRSDRLKSPEGVDIERKRRDMQRDGKGRKSPQSDRSKSPDVTNIGRKRREMQQEDKDRKSRPVDVSGSPEGGRRSASPQRKSPTRSPGSPQAGRKAKSPERPGRSSPERPSSPETSARNGESRRPSPGKGRAKSPTGMGRSSPAKSGRRSPRIEESQMSSSESPSQSTMQDSSASLELISLEALMERVHVQRALLLEEVGRDVLAALPREAPFLKRPSQTRLSDSSRSSQSSDGTVEYLETKAKQVWTEPASEPEPVRTTPKPSRRSRKKQRMEPTDSNAEQSPAAASSETASFEGVQIVVSVRDKSPRRQKGDDEGRTQKAVVEDRDQTDRPARAPPKKSPKKPTKSHGITESTSTSYNSPPERLDPRKSNVLSSLLRTIGQQQEKLDQWRSSIIALKPTPSLEAYVHRLLNMGERSMDALSDVSQVSTPASSVVNDPANAGDELDALLRDRVDDIAQELQGLQQTEGEGGEDELLRLLAERVKRRRAEERRLAETQRRPKEDVRRTSIGKRVVQMEERPADREKALAGRITSLAEQIERVRLERQIIVESSGSGGLSSTRDSTRYESPPSEIRSPVLVPLSPRAVLARMSPQGNGYDDTRYVSPPPSVVTPSSLATRLSPPPAPAAPGPGVSGIADPQDSRAGNRHKPPASMWRSNRGPASPSRPHELSAIAEVETPRLDVSEFPDVMEEMLRRRLISSPLHFSRTQSPAATESSGGERTQRSNGSPPEDLGTELTRLGFGWASATLRKTQATRDLSSSSSPESFGRPPRRSATTTTSRERSGPASPAQTSRERSNPAQTSNERSSFRSPPRTSRDRSTPVRGSEASRSPPLSFRGDTDISTVRGTGSEASHGKS